MEMNMGKFSEKLVELLELAKKKKNDHVEIRRRNNIIDQAGGTGAAGQKEKECTGIPGNQ